MAYYVPLLTPCGSLRHLDRLCVIMVCLTINKPLCAVLQRYWWYGHILMMASIKMLFRRGLSVSCWCLSSSTDPPMDITSIYTFFTTIQFFHNFWRVSVPFSRHLPKFKKIPFSILAFSCQESVPRGVSFSNTWARVFRKKVFFTQHTYPGSGAACLELTVHSMPL